MRHLLATALVLAPLFVAGSAAAASTTIVISEFRTRGPNGANDEFVELLNKSNVPVSLNQMHLMASTAAGVTTDLRRLPNVTLQPGHFYLIAYQGNQSYSGTTPPDLRYTVGTIPDNGGIAIADRNGVIIDAVGMSAGSAYVEGTPLAPMSASVNQSYERKSGGCTANQDTDQNANDFRFNGSGSFPQNLAVDCTSCVGVVCTAPPNNQCWLSAGTCVGGSCVYPQRLVGARCNDSNACTRSDACDVSGACTGPAVTCNTPPKAFCSDPQTLVTYAPTGTCAPSGGCSYTQTVTTCQYSCNGTLGICNPDQCTNVSCNTPPSNGCYQATGTCQQVTGTCVYPKKAAGTSCTDGSACTTGDECDANGGCVAGAATSVDDGNACTADSCDPATGTVSHTNVPNGSDCDDGNRCNGIGTCQAGKCASGPATTCNAPPLGGCSSATGVCNPTSGACTYAPLAAGTTCTDGDDCTTADVCDGSGKCNGSAVPCAPPPPTCVNSNTSRDFSGGSCQPGGNCSYTQTDTDCAFGCDNASGLCAQDPCIGVVCDAPPTQCQVAVGTCSGGQCSYAVAEGAACDDGDPCTGADECTAGGACSGTPLLCNTPPLPACVAGDGTEASRHYDVTGTCTAGDCEYSRNDVPCPFGCDAATGLCKNDPCNTVSCDQPPSQCHQATGTCSRGNCTYELKPAGSTCSDGSPCTDSDVCSDTGACGGTQKTCNTPPPAECIGSSSRTYDAAGACDGTGSCTYTAADTACAQGCDPGSGLCNGDPCIGVTCASPPGACYLDNGTCLAGICVYDTRAAGITCDNLDPCTAGDMCNGSGVCSGTVSASCVDGGAGTGGAPGTDGGVDASTGAGGTSGTDGGSTGEAGTDGSVGGANPGSGGSSVDGSVPADGSVPTDGSTSTGGTGGVGGGGAGGTGNGGTTVTAGGTASIGGTGNGGGTVGTSGGRPSGFGGLSSGAAGSTSGQAGGGALDGGVDGGDGGDGHGHSKDEGGCGCSVPRSSGNAPWALALVAVGVLVARRRRQAA